MNKLFGPFEKAEIIQINAVMNGERRDYHAYVWEKEDNKISLFVPALAVAHVGIHCEDFNSDSALSDAIKYYLIWTVDDCDEIVNIRFPRRYSSLI